MAADLDGADHGGARAGRPRRPAERRQRRQPERQDHGIRRSQGGACPRASRRLDPGDAGKKINGRKRHLVTDTLGLPLALVVHPADVQDRDGLALVCARIRRCLPWLGQLFADGGYRGAVAAAAAARERLALEIVERPAGQHGFAVLPRRWVIERSFAWLSRNRRLAKDFERLIEASTAMVAVAIIQLLLRRLANA